MCTAHPACQLENSLRVKTTPRVSCAAAGARAARRKVEPQPPKPRTQNPKPETHTGGKVQLTRARRKVPYTPHSTTSNPAMSTTKLNAPF
ncbi:hypothetical protein T484DRAFT_1936626 [Baffinella frigidus]|nr:hypothetical protein T484DRAFT_1936626 [Cryptophyta sp. CCMP2293]